MHKSHTLAVCVAAVSFGLISAGCGKKEVKAPDASRIAVKHGMDADLKSVDMTPKTTTVEDLMAAKMPEDVKGDLSSYQDRRVGPFEKTVWQVSAKITSVQLKKDGDYYMKIEGANGGHSVVEVPDPKLLKGSPLEADITSLRKQLEERYHPTKDEKKVNDSASIKGLGFLGWRGRPSGGRIMPGTGITFGPAPDAKKPANDTVRPGK